MTDDDIVYIYVYKPSKGCSSVLQRFENKDLFPYTNVRYGRDMNTLHRDNETNILQCNDTRYEMNALGHNNNEMNILQHNNTRYEMNTLERNDMGYEMNILQRNNARHNDEMNTLERSNTRCVYDKVLKYSRHVFNFILIVLLTVFLYRSHISIYSLIDDLTHAINFTKSFIKVIINDVWILTEFISNGIQFIQNHNKIAMCMVSIYAVCVLVFKLYRIFHPLSTPVVNQIYYR